MLTCYLQGGLGNQLFQIFTTIAYSLKYKKPFTFTNMPQLDTKRSTYWNSFLSPLAKFTKDIKYNKKEEFNRTTDVTKLYEQNFSYNVLPNITDENVILCGYFQSYKYFEEHKKSIMKLIRLDEQKERLKHMIKGNTISMHFRWGDYKNYCEHYPLMTYDYYNKALNYIITELANINSIKAANDRSMNASHIQNVLIFCEKHDLNDIASIIDKLKKTYHNLSFEIINFNISDWEQMLLMSLCQHNIIANSTFSWWGAYFNTNTEKIVCYPGKWFGPKLHENNNMKDLCPLDWNTF